jgi:hypothetical protein
MYKLLVVSFLILFVPFSFAQTPPAPTPAPQEPEQSQTATNSTLDNLMWLVGTWQGKETQQGKEFQTTFTAQAALDQQALTIERTSSGGYKELMVISYDKSSKKTVATLFTNLNNTGIFVADSISNNSVNFSQVTSAEGFKSQRIFEQTGDGQFKFTIKGANPGQELSTLAEAQYTKSGQ